MRRRNFSLASAATLLTLGYGGGSAWAQEQSTSAQSQFDEGIDYRALERHAGTEASADRVEIIEFFWYSCGHCNAFEPMFSAWIKKAPAKFSIKRVPVAFRQSFVPEQKLFYTLSALPNFEQLHSAAFHAIHLNGERLNEDRLILEWARAQKGVDAAQFEQIYSSFTVANQVRKATQLQNAYAVEGVPSMGVAGRYYCDASMTGSLERVLQVVEYLAQL